MRGKPVRGLVIGRCLLAFVLLPALFATVLFSTAVTPAVASEQGVVKVVLDDAYPPYSFRDSSGVLQGLLVDEWHLWEKKTGIRAELHGMDWGEAKRRMEGGEFDVIDTIFETPQRLAQYDFSPPYARLDVSAFFNNDITGVSGLASLKGFPIAVKAGDAAIDMLEAAGIDTLIEYPSYEAILKAAADHKVSVFVVDKPPALYYLHKYGIANKFRQTKPLATGEFHRAVRKGDAATLKQVVAGFAGISPAEHKVIEGRWLNYPAFSDGMLRYVLIAVVVVLLISMVLIGWNYVLRRQVRSRTLALEKEISERIQVESALRVSELKYRRLHESMTEAYVAVDMAGKITDSNQSFQEMVGYTHDELGSLTYFDLTPKRWQEGEDRIVIEQVLIRGYSDIYEKEYFRKDGTILPVELRTFLLRDDQGAPISMWALVRDITERKIAENSLKFSQFTLDHIFESVFWIDKHANIRDANETACHKLGYSREELKRKTVFDIDPVFPRETWPDHWQRIQTQGPSVIETMHRTKDGQVFPVEISLCCFEYEGELWHCAFARDITRLKQAEADQALLREEQVSLEAQLRQAQKMEAVGRLAGGVAHDFNNKLTVILGFADMAGRQELPHERLREYLRHITKAAEQSRDITKQLLAFSRQETISPKITDLNFLIKNSWSGLARLIGEDVRFDITPGEGLWPVFIDPSQIDQVIMNLAVNARDAMPNGGTLLLETNNTSVDASYAHLNPDAKPGDYILLSLSDTGCGMDRKVLEHIFEPFFTTKEVGKGTGLGLAMVYGIVTQNNGFVNVYSEPGKGTTFKLYFPRFHTEEISPEITLVEEIPVHSAIILLVEDEEMVREMTAELLGMVGYEVLVAATPGEAIDLCKKEQRSIDLLLTDVIMPEMSGKELVREIERMRPGIRSLYMSGYTSEVIGRQGVIEGGVNFIQKPFDRLTLTRKIQQVLEA